MEAKTKSWGGLILGGLMLALAGFLIGGYGGSQLTANYLLNNTLSKDARDLRFQVEALQQMRDGDMAQAMELLESRLDQDLILFDPQTPLAGLSAQTNEVIASAIEQARRYRQTQPRQSSSSYTDEVVRQLFNKSAGGKIDKPAKQAMASTPVGEAYKECASPRPEICTTAYIPVCASHSEAGSKTYASACSACADQQVAGYVPGDCKSAAQ